MKPITATMALEEQRNRMTEIAIKTLLHKLRRFMVAYPRVADAQMPDHTIEWKTNFLSDEGNPGRVILDEIMAKPALWAHALPEEVVIVPRKLLERVTPLSPEVIDYLAAHGNQLVFEKAARLRYAVEQKTT